MKCIIDKLTIRHNLKQVPYSFTTEKGTFNDRFVLRYTDKTLGITDLETTLENQLLVSGKTNSYRLFHLPEQ
jgi:hypothetical protein